jgi:hypothetical protein
MEFKQSTGAHISALRPPVRANPAYRGFLQGPFPGLAPAMCRSINWTVDTLPRPAFVLW